MYSRYVVVQLWFCRFLDKAAIIESYDEIEGSKEKKVSWKLATVTMVEETKLIINMIPIWFSSLIFGVCLAQATTLFIKQSNAMDRKIGKSFEVPAATVGSLGAIGMLITVVLYEKMIVPILKRVTGNERGLEILQRIGIGMIFPTLSMVIAALVERKRLIIAAEARKSEASLPMSALWLAPQFLVLGFGDAFALVGLQEYFYEQVPDSMRSLGMAFYLSVIGAGSFISSLLITFIGSITGKFGTSWFGKDLNSSRLDKFYWLLAAITALNFCVYVFIAKSYSYTKVQKNMPVDHGSQGDGTDTMA